MQFKETILLKSSFLFIFINNMGLFKKPHLKLDISGVQ